MVLYVTKPPLAPWRILEHSIYKRLAVQFSPPQPTSLLRPHLSPPPFPSLDVARFRPPDAAPPMPLFHVSTRARATVHHAPYPVFADGYRFFLRRLNFSSPRRLSTRPRSCYPENNSSR